MKKLLPVLLAEPVPDSPDLWRAWCPFCTCYHVHSGEPGHRAAHCVDFRLMESGEFVEIDSPFRDSGYILRLAKEKP